MPHFLSIGEKKIFLILPQKKKKNFNLEKKKIKKKINSHY